jgi:membrane protein AbrB duplication
MSTDPAQRGGGFDRRGVLRQALCLIVSLVGAAAAQWAHIPLAWVLAPLIVTAAFGLAGSPTFAPQSGRRLGQMIIGSSLGLFVTLDVLQRLVGLVPVVAGTGLFSIVACALAGQVFGRVVGIDSTTAFFATTPGGLSEMARVGEEAGGRVDVISLTQAIRVATVVLVLPPAVIAIGLDGGMDSLLPGQDIGYAWAAAIIVAAFAGALVMQAIRFDNPWTMGALFAVGAMTASGLIAGKLPQPLFWAGQFLIGAAIGARFKRETVRSLKKICLAAIPTALITLSVMTCFGLLVSMLAGIDPATAILGASPGGLAEMSVTAQLLHVDVALVVAFHVFRSFFVNGFSRRLHAGLVGLGVLDRPPSRPG